MNFWLDNFLIDPITVWIWTLNWLHCYLQQFWPYLRDRYDKIILLFFLIICSSVDSQSIFNFLWQLASILRRSTRRFLLLIFLFFLSLSELVEIKIKLNLFTSYNWNIMHFAMLPLIEVSGLPESMKKPDPNPNPNQVLRVDKSRVFKIQSGRIRVRFGFL